MTRNDKIGAICTIVFGLAVALIGRDWLVSAFASDAPAAICYTLCAVALGYLACSLVQSEERSGVGIDAPTEKDAPGDAGRERTADEDIDELFAGGLLAELAAIGDAEERSEHVREKVASENDGFTEHRLAALERYGCVRLGYKGDVRRLGGDWIDITRADYPDYDERERMDEALRPDRREQDR